MKQLLLAVTCLMTFVACGPPPKVYWREMLGKAIFDFSEPLPSNGSEKVWIHNMSDSECDKGCQKGVEFVTCDKGLALPALPALPSIGGGNRHDELAYEVFSNYLTQKRKGRVLEPHRHNYMTEANTSTRRKVEVIGDGGKSGVFESCEDLCLLDEAKKRRADKLLTYQILEMKNDEMLIHLRYSDARSGLVELARTLRVTGMAISDASF